MMGKAVSGQLPRMWTGLIIYQSHFCFSVECKTLYGQRYVSPVHGERICSHEGKISLVIPSQCFDIDGKFSFFCAANTKHFIKYCLKYCISIL